MTVETQNQRRVRPWIAALLTVLGLGVGFYYARQSATAWRMVWFGIVVSVLLAAGRLAYVLFTNSSADGLGSSITPVDWVSWLLIAIIAIWAWRATAKQPLVERAGAARLLGYLAVWLVPTLVALVLALTLRVAFAQPFRIPSGAMQPTLQVGDYVVVTKRSYGYSRFSAAPFEGLFPGGRLFAQTPQRGDIAVFRPTPEPDRDFVKRVIGLPGDRIQMIGGVLHINGAPVQRESLGVVDFSDESGAVERIAAWRETLSNGVSYTTFDRNPNGELDNTRMFVVPPGNYFVMGDDRDNSADSRVPSVVGYVPFDNLVGRVDYLKRGATPIARLR